MKLVVLMPLVGLLFANPTAHAAQPAKGKGASPQQAKKELDAAKTKLKNENADLSKAEKEIDKAEAAHKTALAKLQQTRQQASVTHSQRLGLPAVLGQRDALNRELQGVYDAVLKKTRAASEHQAAVKEAEQAKARLAALSEDSAVSDDKKKELRSELSKTMRAPIELERERIEADAQVRDLRGKLGEANKQVAAIQTQVQKAVEEDNGVKTAIQAERDSVEATKTARADVAKQKADVAAAQKKAATESQQLKQAAAKTNAKKKKGKKSP